MPTNAIAEARHADAAELDGKVDVENDVRIAMVFEDRRRPGHWYVQAAGGFSETGAPLKLLRGGREPALARTLASAASFST